MDDSEIDALKTKFILFQSKERFTDIIINTSNDQQIYIPKIFLTSNSEYFKKYFNKNPTQETINLPHRYRILTILFNCVLVGINGQKYIEKTFFSKLKNVDDVCDFISAFDEFEMIPVRDKFDLYLSKKYRIRDFMCSKFISIAVKSGLAQATKRILKVLIETPTLLKNIDFNELKCVDLNFFSATSWGFFIRVLTLWMNSHNPTDEEIAPLMSYDFKTIPYRCIRNVWKIIPKLTRCSVFKSKISDDLMYAIQKNKIKIIGNNNTV
jgi:hypothetical protein